MPYALASGFFEPHGPKAKGILAYQRRNGSRLLGRVRAGAYGLYGPAAYPKSGSSPVYGLNLARFLADNDQPDQLVLGLYGQLATEMTQGTFVSGESVGVAPLPGDHYRSTYLPPNGASNAAFLETLRLMLVHETTDCERRASRSRAGVLDTPRLAASRSADRGAKGADELRPRLVRDRVARRLGQDLARRSRPDAADDAPAAASPAGRRPCRPRCCRTESRTAASCRTARRSSSRPCRGTSSSKRHVA